MDMERSGRPGLIIRTAAWPADELAAQILMRNYAAYLSSSPGGAADIYISGYDSELASLADTWSEPVGVLLLAFLEGEAAGCVAVRIHPDRLLQHEMKRMWVERRMRGHGLGRSLAMAAMEWSRTRGAKFLLLDTVPAAMPEAGALYRSLGFRETERHNDNTVPGLLFLRCDL